MEQKHNLRLIYDYLLENNMTEIAESLASEVSQDVISENEKLILDAILRDELEKAFSLILSSYSALTKEVSTVLTTRLVYITLQNRSFQETLGDLRQADILNKLFSNQDKLAFLSKISALIGKRTKTEQLEGLLIISPLSDSAEKVAKYMQTLISSQKPSLPSIISEFTRQSISNCNYHNESSSNFSLYTDHKCFLNSIPTKELASINCSESEIVNLTLSPSGNLLAVSLKKGNLQVYKLKYKGNTVVFSKIWHFKSLHEENINSVDFNESNNMILTGSKDGYSKLVSLETGIVQNNINLNASEVTFAVFKPNSNLIYISTLKQDIYCVDFSGTPLFSQKSTTANELWYSEFCDCLIVADAFEKNVLSIRIENNTVLSSIPIGDSIVSTAISRTDRGKHVLVNHSLDSPALSLFDLSTGGLERKFFGHKQSKNCYKCSFGGYKDNFVVCGSGDAKLYIWHRSSSIPVYSTKLHSAGLNAIAWGCSEKAKDLIFTGSDDHCLKILASEKIKQLELDEKKPEEAKRQALERVHSSPTADELRYFFNYEEQVSNDDSLSNY